ELRRIGSFELAAIGAEGAQSLEGVALHRYQVPSIAVSATHAFARRFDAECWRAEQVLMAAAALASAGFIPDFILAHSGWGETLPLRAMFPKARMIVYCEFFYRAEGQDVHFDPSAPRFGADGIAALQCKNASSLIALAEADAGVSPTRWQRSTFPKEFQEKIEIVHEGVDLAAVRPDPTASFTAPSGRALHKTDEVITFASRNLEPMRGYHVFLRALPAILRARPEAQVVIAGGDGNSYSHAPPAGRTWKAHCLDQVLADLDLARVHFVGLLDRSSYLSMLQVSSAHVYLTYPFVLSWSLLDAMAAECSIVASDTAPVREVIEDRKNGTLVSFHDHSALAQAVVNALANRALSSQHGAAARKTVAERFDKTVCIQKALRALGVEAPRRDAVVAA
ncbi:MAG: glycosyltransferase, partial [Acetobacteraceae bacterium]|nr:glycosyltransferase [Acetobacteraceae bacterium]